MGRNRQRNRSKGCGFWEDNYWQSDNFNRRTYHMYLDALLSLAVNRFRWVNLPNTCDARFLETQLIKNGRATICHAKNAPDIWQSLICSPIGEFDAYGIPVKWRASGYNQTDYEVDSSNGEIVYDSNTRCNIWNSLEIFARKMTHYSRTEDINLTHQHKPWLLVAPQEKKMELVNLYKQIEGGEPAILGDNNLYDMAKSIMAIDTQVPLVVEDLARAKQNVFNDALLFLGIPHLAFEKGERMIEDEARANSAPTEIMLMNCLKARREACDKLNSRFGLDIQVYFNEDFESYNYNYLNNIEAMAQDGIGDE